MRPSSHYAARLSAAVATVVVLVSSSPARAEGGGLEHAAQEHAAPDHGGHAAEHAHEHEHEEEDERWVALGAAGIGLAAFRKGQSPAAEGGVVASVEFTVIPKWLEIEIGAHYIRFANKSFEMPIDLLLKKPFHVKPWFEPYVGLGPTAVPVFTSEEKRMHFGLATAAGTHFWISHNFGVQAELNYNMVSDHGFVQQLAGVSGVVAAW